MLEHCYVVAMVFLMFVRLLLGHFKGVPDVRALLGVAMVFLLFVRVLLSGF